MDADRHAGLFDAALERLEGGRDILRSPEFQCGDLEAGEAPRIVAQEQQPECASWPNARSAGIRNGLRMPLNRIDDDPLSSMDRR